MSKSKYKDLICSLISSEKQLFALNVIPKRLPCLRQNVNNLYKQKEKEKMYQILNLKINFNLKV